LKATTGISNFQSPFFLARVTRFSTIFADF
jgi:hypothetical protein